ncbi:MAG: hypothetical protein WCR67_05955 [Bacilli bacterium]
MIVKEKMINCCIARTNISYQINNPRLLAEFKKYQTNEKADYSIETILVSSLSVPLSMPDVTNPFQNLYFIGQDTLQVQKREDGTAFAKILYTQNKATIEILKTSPGNSEYLMLEYATIYFVFKAQKAILIHSSAIEFKNQGILFVAKSGVGKSTHASLWEKYEHINRINDDKNLIVLVDDKLYIYPSPISGKHLINQNIIVPLKSIVFIVRGSENKAESLSAKQGFVRLIGHSTNASFFLDKKKWNEVTDHFGSLKYYQLTCDVSQEAVEALKKKLEEDYENQ